MIEQPFLVMIKRKKMNEFYLYSATAADRSDANNQAVAQFAHDMKPDNLREWDVIVVPFSFGKKPILLTQIDGF